MNLYRFHYLKYSNIFELSSYDGTVATNTIDWTFKPFYSNMNEIDIFKILSFLVDYISLSKRRDKCSIDVIHLLDSILITNNIGFNKCDIINSEIKDLFVISGIVNRFKNSLYKNEYCNWYIPNISKKEVEDIYKKYNININNLNLSLKRMCDKTT